MEMADDIDDLLDEVESKFCSTSQPESCIQTKQVYAGSTKKQIESPTRNLDKIQKSCVESHDDAEIMRMIDDIYDVTDAHKDDDDVCVKLSDADTKTSSELNNHSNASHINRRKCVPVYVGGNDSPLGLASSRTKLTCDSLRCTACDFRVSFFNNYEWDASTDYLFLRNNAPDFQKLQQKLVRRKGSRAYCCQCSHRCYKTMAELHDPLVKWVCGKH